MKLNLLFVYFINLFTVIEIRRYKFFSKALPLGMVVRYSSTVIRKIRLRSNETFICSLMRLDSDNVFKQTTFLYGFFLVCEKYSKHGLEIIVRLKSIA